MVAARHFSTAGKVGQMKGRDVPGLSLVELFMRVRNDRVVMAEAGKEAAQVELEAGNSPQVISSNYRELVTPQDAKAWFAIVPAGRAAGRRRVAR